jgi:hypothetical protein
MINNFKIVVFDMDETLGYFLEFGIFWDALSDFIKKDAKDQELFNKTLNLFPEFIRPNIHSILNYLKKKRLNNLCRGVMIYTNNQGSREWVHLIKHYFENNIQYKLFDNVICAYKIKDNYIELCRSCHNKTIQDFFNCTKMPEYAQICFLDDVYHSDMHNDNVYYVKVNPYIYKLGFEEMIDRFIKSNMLALEDNVLFKTKILHKMNKSTFVYFEKPQKDYEIDKIVTKKMMIHLQIFFKKKYNSTTPENNESKKNTRKTRTGEKYNTRKTRQNVF